MSDAPTVLDLPPAPAHLVNDPILRRIKAELASIYGRRLPGVVLYGSHARGDYRQDSDIDIVVRLARRDRHGCRALAPRPVVHRQLHGDEKIAKLSLAWRMALWRAKQFLIMAFLKKGSSCERRRSSRLGEEGACAGPANPLTWECPRLSARQAYTASARASVALIQHSGSRRDRRLTTASRA